MNYYVYPGIEQFKKRQKKSFSPDEIIELVNKYFNVEIRTKTRRQRFVNGRQVAHLLMRRHSSLSLHCIAQIFGVDHTTILWSTRRMEDFLLINDPIGFDYYECEERLLGVSR